jgi:hypothetical protein
MRVVDAIQRAARSVAHAGGHASDADFADETLASVATSRDPGPNGTGSQRRGACVGHVCHTAYVSTTRFVRDEPCSTCGQPVVVIEVHRDAVSARTYQRPPSVTEQHADFRSGLGHRDAVDEQCMRGADASTTSR